MRLISPAGSRIEVSDEKGERWLSLGYQREGAATAAPSSAPDDAPKRRPRPRKATTPDND